ncbi:MAG TPA: beta-N-acetylhexosaminidase, partial [Candidatus Binatia bacterium]|nr:beta-N-acetylhexosaminidase [Candidatus Binatia bacterium]
TDEKRLDELDVNYRRNESVKLGEWTPSQISTTNTTLTWNVTDQIKGPGEFHVAFNYRHGAKGLTIHDVALLEDGHEVDRDGHSGFTGAESRNPVYILKLPAEKNDAKYILQANVAGEGGTDSSGDVSWVFVPNQ